MPIPTHTPFVLLHVTSAEIQKIVRLALTEERIDFGSDYMMSEDRELLDMHVNPALNQLYLSDDNFNEKDVLKNGCKKQVARIANHLAQVKAGKVESDREVPAAST